MRSSCISSENGSNLQVSERKPCLTLPMAIALIVLLGSVFLVLAAYKILPPEPTPISALGSGGVAIAFSTAAIGLLIFGFALKKQYASPEEWQGPTRISDGQKIESSHLIEYETAIGALKLELRKNNKEACLAKFKTLEKNARMKIGNSDPTISYEAKLIHFHNERAFKINAGLDKLAEAIAKI